MSRRRASRALPFDPRTLSAGLRALLPGKGRRPGAAVRALLPLPGRKRRPAPAPSAPPLPARTPPPSRPAKPGTWTAGVHAGPAGGRTYDVYVPAGRRRRNAVPMLLLLHGCGQTPAEFVDATRFTESADRNGFLLVVPHQQSRHHPQRCWRWYEAAHQRRGAGEPAVLAGIVARVGAEEDRWRVDPRRVYVAGLSAGGAMALTLAATYPDVFAAAGVHSAPAHRSASGVRQALAAMAGRTPVPPPEPGAPAIAPTIVVQGGADTVVRAVNGDRVVDQWLAHRAAASRTAPSTTPGATAGVDPVGRSRTETGRVGGREFRVRRWYSTRGRRVLEHWRVDGLGHAWSGGRRDGSYSDPDGPRATTLIWSFLRLHALGRG